MPSKPNPRGRVQQKLTDEFKQTHLKNVFDCPRCGETSYHRIIVTKMETKVKCSDCNHEYPKPITFKKERAVEPPAEVEEPVFPVPEIDPVNQDEGKEVSHGKQEEELSGSGADGLRQTRSEQESESRSQGEESQGTGEEV